MDYRASNYGSFTPIIKNFIIINVIMYFGTMIMQSRGIQLGHLLGMFMPGYPMFKAWQPITHIFMHGGTMHLLFNMYALWLFGRRLEIVWGPKRFVTFYFLTAFAGAFLYFVTVYLQVQTYDPEVIYNVYTYGPDWISGKSLPSSIATADFKSLFSVVGQPVVGASGAIFGLLGANYILFGNTKLMFIFLPFEFKLKHFVLVYGAIELYQGVMANPGDNVAHFAHLGGLIAGIIIVKIWNKTQRNSFY